MFSYYYNTGIPEISLYSRPQAYNSANLGEKSLSRYLMPELKFSQVLAEPYCVETKKSEDIVGEIFQDKVKALKASLESILAQIEARKKLRKDNLRAILQGECRCGTELLQLQDKLKSYAAGPGVDKAKATIEKEFLNLQKEKRFEEVGCWRDLVFLRKELVNTLREYRTALRKQAMLTEK